MRILTQTERDGTAQRLATALCELDEIKEAHAQAAKEHRALVSALEKEIRSLSRLLRTGYTRDEQLPLQIPQVDAKAERDKLLDEARERSRMEAEPG